MSKNGIHLFYRSVHTGSRLQLHYQNGKNHTSVTSLRSAGRCKSGKSTPSKYNKRIKKKDHGSPYTFKPHLNKNSLKIAEKLGTSRNRLTKPSKFMMNKRKSVEKLSRNQSSNYLYQKSPDTLPQSRTYSNYKDAWNMSLNTSNCQFRPAINPKSRQIVSKISKSPVNQSARFHSEMGDMSLNHSHLTW